jgi:hypothetical protein
MVGLSHNRRCIDGTFQVAGDDSINRAILPLEAQLLSLLDATLIEGTLRLPLHDLIGIVNRLTMSY